MPLYHFRCETCAETTQKKLPFGSAEVPPCTTCGKPMMKIIVPPMVHFKGSGFYKTDSSVKQPKAPDAGTSVPEKPKPPTPSPNNP